VDREVFGTGRWPALAMAAVALVVALLLPVMAVLGARPVGLWLVIAIPVVLLPLAGYALWYGVARPVRVEFGADGLAVTQGRRRFTLAWADVRRVGVVHEGDGGAPDTVLVAWPVTAPGRSGVSASAPAAWDPSVGGYTLVRRRLLAAGDDRLAAAVERYAPGRWGVPGR